MQWLKSYPSRQFLKSLFLDVVDLPFFAIKKNLIKIIFLISNKILMDTKNLSGNVVDNKHIVIIYRFYFKVDRTILYMKLPLMN